LAQAILFGAIAGAAIPLGGLCAKWERIGPRWLEAEFRHSVIAFGGGVLLAAVALVLVPEGVKTLPVHWTAVAFGGGGLLFFIVERAIERSGTRAGQVLAMLLDFVPEALAMGAAFATGEPAGVLLALLIAAQNLPEGFNAYRELTAGPHWRRGGALLGWFCLLALLGPLAAWAGNVILADAPSTVGAIMLIASGGILYLTFQDIAPQSRLERHWAPPLGAVAGFLFGLVGQMLLS